MGSGGTNDVVIFSSIMFFLVTLGFFAPLIQSGTNTAVETPNGLDVTLINVTGITDLSNVTDVTFSFWGVLGGIFTSLFLWFSWFPLWLTIIHIGLRLILLLIIYRLIRSGAG
ncbi:MAG: hypothetical protein NTY03_05225 [Candidatus Bathyarchaeota archaeon]|nr:hypothetical protein [Candidatus Bathyarchaeota archaeon]